jgi:hypothetical protein
MPTSPYTFDSPDADVILRAPLHPDDPKSTEFKDFHVHKVILSIASTFFRDMFFVPQPPWQPAQGDDNLPIVDITEPAEVFEIFLRLIYPIEPPAIHSLQIVDHLSQLAIKYPAANVRLKLKQILVSPSFLKSDPVWVYTIACRMDLDEEAELAIPHTYRVDLVQDVPRTVLRGMAAETYNRLLRSHATRREELVSILNREMGIPSWNECSCGPWFYTRLSKNIKLAVWERPVLDKERLNLSLSKVEGIPESKCGLGSSCRISPREVSAFFAGILNAIERLDQTSNHRGRVL